MDNTFNGNLRKIRKAKGITQEQLADAVGVSPQAVSKWEMTSYPDTQLLPVIAEFLGVTIDELFGRGQEETDIYNRVLEHLKELPPQERILEGFEICRAIPQACCGADEYAKIPESISFTDSLVPASSQVMATKPISCGSKRSLILFSNNTR